ncbi:hypothetical protein [Lysinibacillus sp. NPDC096212]|uniref:hypothetical protein n=1 Tax=Lysinibacillus sp. NPDC096212 TaxID=3364135 RepID=UPI0038148686
MPEIQLPTKKTQDEIKTKVDSINTSLATVGKRLKSKVYTENGTFVVPAGVTEVYITGGGAGGGGADSNANSGKAGGTTSFGALLSLSGGAGGNYGSGGLSGGLGGSQGGYPIVTTPNNTGGIGGGSGFYPPTGTFANGAYCCGGGGNGSGSGGGGGHFVADYPVTVTPNTSIPITIGVGGNPGGPGSVGKGGNGILTVKWWE